MRFRLDLIDGTTQEVQIMPGDRMRAERLSTTELPPSQRGTPAVKMFSETWCLLWLWCAATRLHLTTAPFPAFVDSLADYARLDAEGAPVEDGEDPEDAPVDPTRPGASTD